MDLDLIIKSISREAVLDLLHKLVRIPSINPPGEEAAVAEFIDRFLKDLGLSVRRVVTDEGRHNVIARLPGSTGKPIFLFNGHMDVLPAGPGWEKDPFGGDVIDGKLYGRGSVDMKAGLASIIMAVETMVRNEVPLRGDVLITAVSDEVGGGYQGTGYLVKHGEIQADMAVVAEPTGRDIRIAHRGDCWFEIKALGKSAHSGRPHLGVNAISKMARLIQMLEEELAPVLSKKKHWILPSPTISVGRIEGGAKVNMVAGECRIELDRRTLPGESQEEIRAELQAVVDRAQKELNIPFEVNQFMMVEPAEISPEAQIVQECKKAYLHIMGEEPNIGCTAGFEDAHFLINDAKIPTAMFGPYWSTEDPTQPFFTTSGSPYEHVDIDSVVGATKIFAQMILNIVG
jgi:acetylornithine deacetylase/succinyl-diaminopimelate desuccinylase family protein